VVKSWEGYAANMTIENLKVEIEQLVRNGN